MPLENNGTLQKGHMANNPLKIDQIQHPQNMVPNKNGTPCKKMPKGHMPRTELCDFLKGILKFVV